MTSSERRDVVSEQFALDLARKPLFIPLRGEWWDRFADGSKTTEWRAYGPRWNLDQVQRGRGVVLSRGYRGPRLAGVILDARKVPRDRAPVVAREIYPTAGYFCAFHIQLNDGIPRN
jgi:hypothetical protein